MYYLETNPNNTQSTNHVFQSSLRPSIHDNNRKPVSNQNHLSKKNTFFQQSLPTPPNTVKVKPTNKHLLSSFELNQSEKFHLNSNQTRRIKDNFENNPFSERQTKVENPLQKQNRLNSIQDYLGSKAMSLTLTQNYSIVDYPEITYYKPTSKEVNILLSSRKESTQHNKQRQIIGSVNGLPFYMR